MPLSLRIKRHVPGIANMGTSTSPTQLPPRRGRIRWGRGLLFGLLGLPLGWVLAGQIGPDGVSMSWAPLILFGPAVTAFLLGARRRRVVSPPEPMLPADPVEVAKAALAEQERSGTIEFILAIGIVALLTLLGGPVGFIAGLLVFLIFALSTRSTMAEKRAAVEKAEQQSQRSEPGRTPSA